MYTGAKGERQVILQWIHLMEKISLSKSDELHPTNDYFSLLTLEGIPKASSDTSIYNEEL